MKVKCNEELTRKTFYALLCGLSSMVREACLTTALRKQLLWLFILISRVSNRNICSMQIWSMHQNQQRKQMLRNQCNTLGRKINVTLSPICWNEKWNKYYQLSTWMLILPSGNGWEISTEVTYNDYAHTYLSPSGIIVSAPDPPYFLLFIFYRHSFHLAHKLNLILSIEWLEILLLLPPNLQSETVISLVCLHRGFPLV